MAKRLFQLLVLFFAVYAFAFVPLGELTALEHVRAICGTPAAHQAASEVKGGVERLVRRLRDQAQRSTERSDEPLPFEAESAEDKSLEKARPRPDRERIEPSAHKPRERLPSAPRASNEKR
jgi:hypothetical protein